MCAFANAIGGFLIVGASLDGDAGAWRIDPVDFTDEPQTWLARVITSNLRPVPFFDIKAWERAGRHVAVVRVDEISEPPCMTIDGEVYVRVSGESSPVTDPATLRRLHERGEARAAGAKAEALRTAAVSEGVYPERRTLRLRVAIAPTGRTDDIGGRLFTQSFCDRMIAAAERLPAVPLLPSPPCHAFGRRTTQNALVVWELTGDNPQRWTLEANWDGSVAVELHVQADADPARLLDTAIFQDAVWPAFLTAIDLAKALGGYGRAHAVLVVHARRFEIMSINGNMGPIPGPSTIRPMQAWTDADGNLAAETLDRMRRDLCRAAGAVVWEPEPPEVDA